MQNFDVFNSENPTFKSWKWMISEEENEDDEEFDEDLE